MEPNSTLTKQGQTDQSHSDRAHSDLGFTLTEMLITLLIMPIVVGALVTMLLVIFQREGPVNQQLTGAVDSQIVSASLVSDVQSANFITTNPTPSCGSTGTQILAIEGQNNSMIVSYDVVTMGSRYELVRYECTQSNTSSPIAILVISNSVSHTQTANVHCTAAVTCNLTSAWVTAAGVTGVSMTVNEIAPSAAVTSFSISAAPRLWNAASSGASGGGSSTAPLELLGNGSCPQTTMTLSGSARITVASGSGTVIDNSTCSPSIQMSGSAQISAASLTTADTTPASSIAKSGSASAPNPVYAVSSGDPFATLNAPLMPTASGTGACPAAGTSGSCTPGNFSSSLSISGSGTVLFGVGTYVFTQPVSISGSTTVVFGSGTYWFEGGLSISGSAAVTFDSGTYIYQGTTSTANALTTSGSATLTSGSGGTIFYVASGTTNFSGSGVISLSGESQFDGVALWQAKSDTNAVSLSGSSSIGTSYGGVYVPGANVGPSGSSAVVAAFVVAYSVSFTGSSSLTVG